MKTSLKAILSDALRVRKVLTRDDVFKIAKENGYLQSTAERCLRMKNGDIIPTVKINKKKQVCTGGEFISYWMYVGSTALKDLIENKK